MQTHQSHLQNKTRTGSQKLNLSKDESLKMDRISGKKIQIADKIKEKFINNTSDNNELNENISARRCSNNKHNFENYRPKSESFIKNELQNNIGRNNHTPSIEISELVHNENDDNKTLINKNAKLRGLLVQASNKLSEIVIKFNEKEEEFKLEKTNILDELDKISNNYKRYAEGFQNFQSLEVQLQNLQNDYNHNYQVIICYQSSLSMFLKDYMELFKLIVSFLSNKITKNPLQFLFDIKELIFENLSKYREVVDILNCRDIYEQFNEIVNKSSRQMTYSTISQQNTGRVNFIDNINSNPDLLNTNSARNKKSISPTQIHNENKINKNISRKNTNNPTNQIIQNVYNYPPHHLIKMLKIKNDTSFDKLKPNPIQNFHQKSLSVDNLIEDQNKYVQNQSHIQNYYHQGNTSNINGFADSSSNIEKMSNSFLASKESLNTSNRSGAYGTHYSKNLISKPAEKQKIKKKQNLQDKKYNQKQIFGYVIQDFQKSREHEISCKEGDLVEIISVNKNDGYLYILNEDRKGLIPESYIKWD